MISYLIMKVVGKCNLGCSYCYYMNDLADPFRVRMSMDTIESTFKSLRDYCRENSQGTIAFAWHGGEPTLVGKDFYRDVVELEHLYFADEIRVWNLIQTNATLLDAEWADLFATNGFSVGVSLDGSKASHDRYRVYRSGKGSYDKVLRSISFLVDAGVRFGTITVIDPTLDGREVFRHHYDAGIRKMDFNLPIVSMENFEKQWGADAVGDFADFMCGVFDAWLDLDDPEVDVRSLASLIQRLFGGPPSHCHSSNSCGRFVTIEPNGDVGLCENLRVIPESSPSLLQIKGLRGGLSDTYHTTTNVRSNSFADIQQAVDRKFDHFRFNRRGDICEQCSVKDVCNSGCPVHRHRSGESGFSNPSFFCNYYKRLIEHISQRLRREIEADIPRKEEIAVG